MVSIEIHVNDTEAKLIRKYAKCEGKTISDFLRDAVFDRIEDIRDSEALRASIAQDDSKRYSQTEMLKQLGL